MTSQQAKEWLNRDFGLWKQLRSLYHKRDSQTFANISQYEEGFSSTAGNRSEMKMMSYAELNSRIEKLERQLKASDKVTKQILENVTDSVYWSILTDRYISRLGWSQIAKNHNYSRAQIFRIHGEALVEVRRFVPDEE